MDELSFDFRERVAALWKCCEPEYGNSHFPGCLNRRVPDCEWTMNSKKQGIWFYIGHDNGEWSYRFTNPDRTEGAKGYLSMVELKKNPNLKHVRIGKIDVKEATIIAMHPLRTLEEMERLMKFVVFLSNEPRLQLDTSNVFDSPEGAIILNFLSKMTFSQIYASYGFSVYNQIVENQFARRRPTTLDIESFGHNREFFVEHVGNGNIKRFTSTLLPFSVPFSAELMERIINRFVENPEIHVYIKAKFEESTKEILERKLAEGSCEKAVRTHATEYRFKASNPKMEKNSCMCITYGSCWSDPEITISIC